MLSTATWRVANRKSSHRPFVDTSHFAPSLRQSSVDVPQLRMPGDRLTHLRQPRRGCLWSRWTAPGEPDLLSFAAITDEPPPEIAAAGHDRCIIPIKPENVDAWLNPDRSNLEAMYAILDDRDRPYYEHRLAA